MESLTNIVFDNEDRELFLIDDLQLKANAIRVSILPKLQLVMHYAISQIDETYDVNVFDDCMIAQAPHYRLSGRQNEVKKNFEYARVSIRVQRKTEKLKGIEKLDGKELKVSPFSLDIKLVKDGLIISLGNQNQQISKKSNTKIFDFISKYSSTINLIQKSARVFNNRISTENDWFISDVKWLKNKLKRNDFDISMFSDYIPYPIVYKHLKLVIDRLTLLYPIFHSYVQIAKGEEIQFPDLIVKFKTPLLLKERELPLNRHIIENSPDLSAIKERAATKIKVMPGIRWQVFKRDNWRCVGCGVRAVENDTIILHVDHIIPRSKGGKDEIDNYQTLCDKCNIGKSNKDNIDLRKR